MPLDHRFTSNRFAPSRRQMLAAAAGLALLAPLPAIAQQPPPGRPPVVFVHGNGDNATSWMTQIWRFESNGYAASDLYPVDFAAPLAPNDDTRAEVNRSTTADQAAELAGAVTRTLIATGAQKVALVGNSRGANTIRNYVKFGGGHASTATVVLGGGVNHGVYKAPVNLGNEFNGAGAFMTRLNDGSEVYPGIAFFTTRSDKLDKYAQPTGEFIGRPGQPTGIYFDAPALEGAENIVLDGLDHREVAYHARAFPVIYQAITGTAPKTLDIVAQEAPILDGIVSGVENNAPTNRPFPGATVAIWQIDQKTGARTQTDPLHRKTVGADGRWGPFNASPTAYYEVELAAPGFRTHHIYFSPFPRSTRYLDLRFVRVDAKFDQATHAITVNRPRGYFGLERDKLSVGGKLPDGVTPGVPAAFQATAALESADAVPVVLNGETLMVRPESIADGHVALVLFHY